MTAHERKGNILAVIPARSGSKRISNKNTRKLGNKSLIAYIIESAKKSKLIDRLVLSTNGDNIADIGRSLGAEVPFKRPDHLSSDNVPLISVIRHAYDYFKDRGFHYDAVLSLQPTCPFTSTQTIDKVISLWQQSKCDSVTTVAEIKHGHPYIAKSLEEDNGIRDFCNIPKNAVVVPSQKRRKAYYLTGGIYLRSVKLLELDNISGHCLGNDARAITLNEVEAVDINTEIDFKFAEFLIASGKIDL